MNPKFVQFLVVAFTLFAIDICFTYNTFVIRNVPLSYEVNSLFRDWVVRDGWMISVGKFTVIKSVLFGLCGWLIFGTRNQTAAHVFSQLIISNHWVAITSHPTLWWIADSELRTVLLVSVGILSLLFTFFGIRYLRTHPIKQPLRSLPELTSWAVERMACK